MGKHDSKIEKVIKMRVQVRVWAQKLSRVVNSMGGLGAPDTENASEQQANDTQGVATHSGLWSKKTR